MDEDRPVETPFVLIIMIDHPLGDPSSTDDLAQRAPLIALLGEDFGCLLQDEGARPSRY